MVHVNLCSTCFIGTQASGNDVTKWSRKHPGTKLSWVRSVPHNDIYIQIQLVWILISNRAVLWWDGHYAKFVPLLWEGKFPFFSQKTHVFPLEFQQINFPVKTKFFLQMLVGHLDVYRVKLLWSYDVIRLTIQTKKRYKIGDKQRWNKTDRK